MSEKMVLEFIGWFREGIPTGWRISDTKLLEVSDRGVVKLNGVEIVPWSEACKKSKETRNWIKP